MNTVKMHKTKFWLMAWVLPLFGTAVVHAADNKQPAAPPSPPRSVFVQPANVKEGRDPFFPESVRTPTEATTSKTTPNQSADVTSLKVRGISGTPDHLLAIINNHTFGEGEEGDVLTSSGRIHLRCLEVRHDSVTVEINGRIQHLNLEANK